MKSRKLLVLVVAGLAACLGVYALLNVNHDDRGRGGPTPMIETAMGRPTSPRHDPNSGGGPRPVD